LGRLNAAITESGLGSRARFDMFAYRDGRLHTQVDRQDFAAALRLVNDSQREADANGEHLTFQIRPVWPTLTVDGRGMSVTDVEPAQAVVSPLFDPAKTDRRVQEEMRAAGVLADLRIRSDETHSGRVQTIVTCREGELTPMQWQRMMEAATTLPGIPEYVAPWGTRGVKIIWGGVR
jgi:hypothetical protein